MEENILPSIVIKKKMNFWDNVPYEGRGEGLKKLLENISVRNISQIPSNIKIISWAFSNANRPF